MTRNNVTRWLDNFGWNIVKPLGLCILKIWYNLFNLILTKSGKLKINSNMLLVIWHMDFLCQYTFILLTPRRHIFGHFFVKLDNTDQHCALVILIYTIGRKIAWWKFMQPPPSRDGISAWETYSLMERSFTGQWINVLKYHKNTQQSVCFSPLGAPHEDKIVNLIPVHYSTALSQDLSKTVDFLGWISISVN